MMEPYIYKPGEPDPLWMAGLDSRHRSEIKLARTYVQSFNHGTAGHLGYQVIEALAAKLDHLTKLLNAQHNALAADGKVECRCLVQCGDESGE